jgi:hypothetical protein
MTKGKWKCNAEPKLKDMGESEVCNSAVLTAKEKQTRGESIDSTALWPPYGRQPATRTARTASAGHSAEHPQPSTASQPERQPDGTACASNSAEQPQPQPVAASTRTSPTANADQTATASRSHHRTARQPDPVPPRHVGKCQPPGRTHALSQPAMGRCQPSRNHTDCQPVSWCQLALQVAARPAYHQAGSKYRHHRACYEQGHPDTTPAPPRQGKRGKDRES